MARGPRVKYSIEVDGRAVEGCGDLNEAQELALALLGKSDDVVIHEYPDDARVPMGTYHFDRDVGWVRREAPQQPR